MAVVVAGLHGEFLEALHQFPSSEQRFLSSFDLLLEIWIGITPDRIEILVGALSSSTLPEKTYKRPPKPNIKCRGDLWTSGGRAPPGVFFL